MYGTMNIKKYVDGILFFYLISGFVMSKSGLGVSSSLSKHW
jgi:hypothetical protein